ncbi:Protein kinase domain-containing protein [Cinnamomum micranthum f. kanehirae]|uniref:non-specific serine/threonine protein kinase n=1 Tax=Cinnamomum micranthum f. kanehirae TaxID=337451 RepID=A0A3S3NTP0_9MAGN|nr:Protein kinase domain-containing protein [Cinnamomum micranthum f. kanehirae]
MNLDDDGRIYLLNNAGFNIKTLTNGGYPRNPLVTYRVTLDADGIFRLYSHDFSSDSSSTPTILWEPFRDGCIVKGLCGLNGFCTLMDTKADCSCPPGFIFVDPDYPFRGCGRNFPRPSCARNKKENTKYSMSSLENTAWLNEPYEFHLSMTKDECRESCLQDCYCEAALYSDGICNKQKLPLSFGRRNVSGTTATTTFIKVGNGSPADEPSIWPGTPANGRRGVRIEILIACIALAAGSFIGFAIFYFLVYRRHRLRYEAINNQPNISLTEGISLRSFSYVELEKATECFKEELGKGAFGTVFKGVLSNKFIAVKRLDNMVEDGEREFQAEMRAIGRIHHKNLVRLLGFSDDGSHKLLVYEYMSNGSLADLIFRPESCPNWEERVRIALDIARGILYLHEDCETQIIHCDIKPQNILMDGSHSAKLSDFGLAKLMKPDQTKTFTGIRGTRGYVAPEWHRNMPITVKADVYSFGVVLLEIICCRKNVEKKAPENEIILSDWAYNCFKAGELTKLISEEEVDVSMLEKMLMIGLWCIQDEPSLRPSMKKVVLMLEGIVDIPVPPINSFVSS